MLKANPESSTTTIPIATTTISIRTRSDRSIAVGSRNANTLRRPLKLVVRKANKALLIVAMLTLTACMPTIPDSLLRVNLNDNDI